MTPSLSRRVLLALVVGAAAFAPAGCSTRSAQSSRATAAVSGRHIQARGDVPVAVRNYGDHALVSIASHQLTVERDRVLLDGAELTKLPAAATQIHVNAAGGQLTVTADGVTIASKQLER